MDAFLETCQICLESVRECLKEAYASTPEVSLIQDAVVDVDQQWPEVARNLCKILLFGDWMRLTMTINIAINFLYSIFFSEVETQQKVEESKLPSHMQKKVDEITEYLKKCQSVVKRTEKIIHSLIEEVRIHLITAGVVFNNHVCRLWILFLYYRTSFPSPHSSQNVTSLLHQWFLLLVYFTRSRIYVVHLNYQLEFGKFGFACKLWAPILWI